MKKLLLFFGILMIGLTISGCDDTSVEVIAPTFGEVVIEGIDPFDGTELVTFYKGRNSDLAVRIALNNPSDAQITSIVINGYNYRFTRFTEESTNENIFFEISTGTALGETIYSVDEIIYQDGANSETVYISNNNEFAVYVFKDEPTVERENYDLDKDSISIDFIITDFNSVIEPGSLVAELYSGETLIDSEDLVVGESSVNFDELLANKHYEVKVSATYDLDDSTGEKTDVPLYSGLFATLSNSLPSGQIQNVVINSNKVTFDVVYNDGDEVTMPGGLSVGVYKEDELIEEFGLMGSTTEISFDDLLNDNDYVLKVMSDYDLRDGHATQPNNVIYMFGFTTDPQGVPEPLLYNLNIEENRVLFDILIDDPDGLIDASTLVAKLYIEGELVKEAFMVDYIVDFVLFNLTSGEEFVIEIEASYDLNDGEELQTEQVIFSQAFTTLINQPPLIFVEDIIITQGYVTIDLEVVDDHETLIGAFYAILYENDLPVYTIPFDIEATQLVFPFLIKNTEAYRVEIISDYNLRDGLPFHDDATLFTSLLETVEAKAPAAEFINILAFNDMISLEINFMDSDLTVDPNSLVAYIYLNGIEIDTKDLIVGSNDIEFLALLSNNEYEIRVYADYDLDDGAGLQDDRLLISAFVLTLEKEIPNVVVSEETTDTESISFDVYVEDIDDVLELVIDVLTINAILYLDGVPTGDVFPLVAGDNIGVLFDELLSDTLYSIEIVGDYNLDDGNETEVNYLFGFVELRTSEKYAPIGEILAIDADQDSITIDYEITDDDNVITTDTLFAVLYIYDELLGYLPAEDTAPLIIGAGSSVTFNGVLSDHKYKVSIETDYYLNDGSDPVLAEPLDFMTVETIKKELMTAVFDQELLVIGKDFVNFAIFIEDLDGVIFSDLVAILYLDELPIGDPIDLVVGDNLGLSFIDLQSDSTYLIQVEATIDINEGGLVETEHLFGEQAVYTEFLIDPTAVLTIGDIYNTEIQFDVLVIDDDLTSFNRRAVLYEDGLPTLSEIPLIIGSNPGLSFTGLEFGKEYEIVVVTDYNLNDGGLDFIDAELTRETGTTIGIVELVDVVEEKLRIYFNVVIDDQFSVLEDPELLVEIFDENDNPVGGIHTLSTSQNMQLINLWSNFEYYMIVTATYDVGLGDGTVTTEVYRHEFKTLELDPPPLSISNLVISDTLPEIIFDVKNVIDPDNIVIPGTLFVNLYRNGLLVDSYGLGMGFDNDGIVFAFDGTDGAEYVLKIEATVDLNDSYGPIALYEIYTTSFVYTIKTLS